MDEKVFKLENDKWVPNVPKLELILNEANIVEDGDIKVVFGFGPILVTYDDEGNEVEKKSLTLATKFQTKPADIIHDKDNEEYRYIYYGDSDEDCVFLMSKNIIKDITNVEYMFNLISAGKISTRIDWRKYIKIILNNMELNKSLDVSERDIEILLAEYLRDAEDPSKPVRVTGSDEYTVLSFRYLTAQQSTFNSVSFEDPKTMLAASLTRKEHEETPSPLEKFMRV